MNDQKILALSSSRVGDSGFLEKAIPYIKALLDDRPLKIAFIPFALVDADTTPLTNMLRQALAHLPSTIHTVNKDNASSVIEDCDAIMVSGGNTFKLLHDIYRFNLVKVIRQKVASGTPYIGWSAGANITGATISTTNDMPVIEPESFTALGLFPFQINPHYYNQPVAGFNGETRDQRLTEFVKLHPAVPIVCLPEGTAMLYENAKLKFTGIVPGVLMRNVNGDMQKTPVAIGEDITHLMRSHHSIA